MVLYFTLKYGLWVVLHTFYVFCFIHFSMKFMYVNRTSPDGCWATLTDIDKDYALVICNHGIKPEGAGD